MAEYGSETIISLFDKGVTIMHWENYRGLHCPYEDTAPIKRRYSITADVLSYQLCPKQYAFHRIRKYESSMTNQIYYGTVIHQVLDRAHIHYSGKVNPATKGNLPSDYDIEQYFDEVDCALKARRISAGTVIKQQALEIIKRFNRVEGPLLYPRVKNTECRLQVDKADYILNGNVDVLAISPDDPDSVEIWDYKGTMALPLGDPRLQQYTYQMQVYAELYRKQTGIMPKKAIIYFLKTLEGPVEPKKTPGNAMFEVKLDSATVDTAMNNFSSTVARIEHSRATGIWDPPDNPPPSETCNICDKRWNCDCTPQTYSMRYP